MIDKTLWTPVNLAWLTGVLEGEASFLFDRRNLVVKCEMTDEDIILRCREVAGFGNITSRTRQGKLQSWTWKSSRTKDVAEFSGKIFPMLGFRRQEQILTAMNKRRDFELSATGHNLIRIFPSDSSRVFPVTA